MLRTRRRQSRRIRIGPGFRARRVLRPLLVAILALFAPRPVVQAGDGLPGAREQGGTPGRAMLTPRRVDRLIVIGPSAAEIVCALGACDRIVGVDRFTTYPPELSDRPRVGGLFDPDLERIASLLPSLVILRGRSEPLERLCEQSAILLFNDQTDSFSTLHETINRLGALLDRPMQARALNQTVDSALDRIRARGAHRDSPRVLLTISRQPGSFSNVLTAGHGTFLTELIDIAGGQNVFAEMPLAYPQVSPESLLSAQPDVILEFRPGESGDESARAELRLEWSRLGPSPAARTGRIHLIADDHALVPSPRIIAVAERVSRLIHPEAEDDDTERTASDAAPGSVRIPER